MSLPDFDIVESHTALRFGYGLKFSRIGAVQDYVNSILQSDFWKARCPDVDCVDVVTFKDPKVKHSINRYGLAKSTYALTFYHPNVDEYVLAFNQKRRCATSQIVVLHELAHVITENDTNHAAPEYGGHTEGFRNAYIELIEEFMPEETKRLAVLREQLFE